MKIIWTTFFITAISGLGLVIIGCNGDVNVEEITNVDFQFINTTDSALAFRAYEIQGYDSIKIDAQSASVIYEYRNFRARGNISIEDVLKGSIRNAIGIDEFAVLKINDTLCVVQKNEHLASADNYKKELISEKSYLFTYTFEPDDFEGAFECK